MTGTYNPQCPHCSKEFDDDNHMNASKEGLLIKLEDRSISVAIFSKGSKTDEMFTKWEKS